MVNENIKSMKLQIMYLGISLLSSFCITTNYHVITCANIVGLMCLVDLCFIKKNDMRLHHILVLCMLHYMNVHPNIKNRNEIVSTILSTEVSTIFLTMNNLLDNLNNLVILKKINKCFFVSTFVYYRIYNYSCYLIFDKNTHYIFLNYSKNNFEFYKIHIGIYGLFLLNLYWGCFILNKIICKNNKFIFF